MQCITCIRQAERSPLRPFSVYAESKKDADHKTAQLKPILDNRPDLMEKLRSGEMRPMAVIWEYRWDEARKNAGPLPADKYQVLYVYPP